MGVKIFIVRNNKVVDLVAMGFGVSINAQITRAQRSQTLFLRNNQTQNALSVTHDTFSAARRKVSHQAKYLWREKREINHCSSFYRPPSSSIPGADPYAPKDPAFSACGWTICGGGWKMLVRRWRLQLFIYLDVIPFNWSISNTNLIQHFANITPPAPHFLDYSWIIFARCHFIWVSDLGAAS